MRYILDCLFKKNCLFCLATCENSICQNCIKILPYNTSVCLKCAKPLPKDNLTVCGKCLLKPPAYDQLIALFKYEAPVNKMITNLKFQRQLRHVETIAWLLAEYIQPFYQKQKMPQCIIPVPLHKRRLQQRGFNQALEIAKPLAKYLNIPINIACCYRKRHTEAQSKLSAFLRQKNVKNAFASKERVGFSHVAILDDVVTTGNTVNELSKLLKKQHIKKIDVWCFCK